MQPGPWICRHQSIRGPRACGTRVAEGDASAASEHQGTSACGIRPWAWGIRVSGHGRVASEQRRYQRLPSKQLQAHKICKHHHHHVAQRTWSTTHCICHMPPKRCGPLIVMQVHCVGMGIEVRQLSIALAKRFGSNVAAASTIDVGVAPEGPIELALSWHAELACAVGGEQAALANPGQEAAGRLLAISKGT